MNQVLSQDEINALLRGLSDGDIETETVAQEAVDGPRKYDLASQERIIRGRMPTMELVHDNFARSYRTTLSKFLGRTCFINVGSIEIVKFGQFMKKLPLPSSLHIFRMPPLLGHGLLVASTPLLFAIVDVLFGGKGTGKVKIEGREYTPIETRLIRRVVQMALDTLKEAWSPVHPIDFIYVRGEFNPLAIAIVAPTDVVIIVNIEIELEQESTTLTICIPYSTVEPIRTKLTTGFQTSRLSSEAPGMQRMQKNISLTDVNLSVWLANGEVRARDLVDLKVGDILPLATNVGEEAVVSVEGVPKYRAYVGTYRGSKAIRLTSAIYEEE